MPDRLELQVDATTRNWLEAGSINIFAEPFGGKDTQGERLATIFDAPLLGGGDILRNSQIPPDIKEVMDRGELIPSDDFVRIVLPYLSQPDFAGRPLILSAVGRWIGEEEGVLRATNEAGHPIKAAVFLVIGKETIWERWEERDEANTRGERADDDPAALTVRLQEFENKTLPVIERYREQGLLIEVDGTGTKDEVTTRILGALAQKATQA